MDSISSIVKCIVSGHKQGGTSFLSSVIAAHSGLESRFECGILQADKPSEIVNIKPAVLENLKRHWDIDAGTIEAMAGQEKFSDAYQVLVSHSPGIGEEALLVDKFPDYCLVLENLLEKFDVPGLFISRDPRAILWSRQKRTIPYELRKTEAKRCEKISDLSISIDGFIADYVLCMERAYKAKFRFPDRVFMLNLEDLVENFDTERKKIFDFLGEDEPEEMFGDTNVKKEKVRPGLDFSSLIGFSEFLGEEIQIYVLEKVNRRLRNLNVF
jgi:sulfotransferase family protein